MPGPRIDRFTHVALAGGSLALSACVGGGPDTAPDAASSTSDSEDPATTLNPTTDPPLPPPVDNTPPALVDIEFLDPQLLRLTFSEPIAPVDQVNPKRFRLSVSRYSGGDYGGTTQYYDPAQFNTGDDCDGSCDTDGDVDCEPCYQGPPSRVYGVDMLPDAVNPAQALLQLARPILPSLCKVANGFDGDNLGGLLLHYADGGAAQITDLAGLPLAPRGKTWVVQAEADSMSVIDEEFPEFDPFRPTVPCPLGAARRRFGSG